MADAGLSHGGFYNHFASKDEFISETLSRVWSDCQRVSGLEDGTAAAALNRFLGQYLSTAQCERSRGACLLPIALPDADKLPPQAREVLHAAILELTGQIQACSRNSVKRIPQTPRPC
jgi:TetR/AcrR family transcriptional repressor of nem operon